MATATIRDVELVSAGTWPASSGPATITAADLDAILEASRDHVIDRAPLKFGHVSAFNAAVTDGDPAYGWVRPTRVTTGRNGLPTLLGDIEGIPAKLADVVRHAYPRRSAEILWNATTHAGKKYRAALKGLALLGASAPAVKGLDDIAGLYSAATNLDGTTGDVLVVDDETERLTLLAAAMPAPDAAHIPPATIDTPKDGPMTNTTTAPVVDEAGLRTALGVAADADLDAALNGYMQTRTTTAPAAPVATDTDPAKSVDPTPDAGETTSTQGDADPAKQTEAPAPQSEAASDATVNTADAPVAAAPGQTGPGTVTLSEEVYAELTALAAEHRAARRAGTVDKAIADGKITPHERAAYLSAIESDEATTTTLLSALAPKFATTELGHAGTTGPVTTEIDAALDRWAETGQL